MAFKRALWTSGYTYLATCSNCGTQIQSTDRDLDYRAWYPNGFVYCPRCRTPVRHDEFFAVNPDGTNVYATHADANRAVEEGYLRAIGAQPQQIQPIATNRMFCTSCGRPYVKGKDAFCSGCGKKLD